MGSKNGMLKDFVQSPADWQYYGANRDSTSAISRGNERNFGKRDSCENRVPASYVSIYRVANSRWLDDLPRQGVAQNLTCGSLTREGKWTEVARTISKAGEGPRVNPISGSSRQKLEPFNRRCKIATPNTTKVQWRLIAILIGEEGGYQCAERGLEPTSLVTGMTRLEMRQRRCREAQCQGGS